MKEGIIFSLLIGFLILSFYLNIRNGCFKKIYILIDQKQKIKLSLISLFLIFFPSLIWFIYCFIQSNNFWIVDITNNTIPAPIQAAFISAFIAWWISSQRNKTQLVFDLHNEFNSKEMYEARNKADNFLANIPSKINLKDLYNQQKSPDEIQNVFLVMRFYERLWVAIDNDQLKKELVPTLFGELFYWWSIYCFDKRLLAANIDWDAKKKIDDLKDWMNSNTKELDRNRWIYLAENDKKTRKMKTTID